MEKNRATPATDSRLRLVRTATGDETHIGYEVDGRLDPYTVCGSRSRRILGTEFSTATCERCIGGRY